MDKKFKLALCQTMPLHDKEKSKEMAASYIKTAVGEGSEMVSLPEMWNCPYINSLFRKYSEPEDGESVQFMSDLARKHGIYLIGGSIPERESGVSLEDSNIYNTSFVFDPKGNLIGKHRKIHLFDIDIKGKITFMESATLSAGDTLTVIDTEFLKLGVALCYDVRFPKLFNKMADLGAKLMILPAAFNTTTGPAHWEILMKARALDNQVYFAANSSARDPESTYQTYGHSMVVNPWGEIIGETDETLSIVYADIDLDFVDSVREQIPISKQKKPELY